MNAFAPIVHLQLFGGVAGEYPFEVLLPEIIRRCGENGEDEKRDYRWSALGEEGRKHAGAQSDEGRLGGCCQDWGSHFVAYNM